MIRGLFNKAGLSSESFMPCSLEQMTLMMFSAKCVSAMLGETIALTAIATA